MVFTYGVGLVNTARCFVFAVFFSQNYYNVTAWKLELGFISFRILANMLGKHQSSISVFGFELLTKKVKVYLLCFN